MPSHSHEPRTYIAALIIAVVAPACSRATAPLSHIPDFVNCAVFPESRTSAYVLPYAVGEEFRSGRTFSHYLPSNGGVGLYAVDIPMPLGAPVRAIRSGVVVAVEERFSDDDHADYHENWVMIRHADSTVARYIHLTQNGAAVDVGQDVAQGDLVGFAGNSGASLGPHLHLDVQTCGPNLPPGYNRQPCGMTVPLSFRNATAEACGLVPGKVYRAQPFTRDDR